MVRLIRRAIAAGRPLPIAAMMALSVLVTATHAGAQTATAPEGSAISFALTAVSTTPLTSDETSLSLVWEENLGSGTLTESTQVRPSRASSPPTETFSRLAAPDDSA